MYSYLIAVKLVEDVSAFRLVEDLDDGDEDLDDRKLSEAENAADVLKNSLRQLPVSMQLERRKQN